MWYVELVLRMHDLLRVTEPPPQFTYVSQWLGQLLVCGQMYGMGTLGLLCALWALFKLRSGWMGLLALILLTICLPVLYGVLTGFFIPFASHCGGGMVYIYFGPFCALPASAPAWIVFLVVWATVGIGRYVSKRRSLPPAP